MSDSDSKKKLPGSGEGGKRLLTHESAVRQPDEAGEKPIRATRPSPPPVAGKASLTERLTAGTPAVNPAALSEKMAAISSLRESTTPEGKPAWHERAKMMSSLPDALSRVDRRLRLQEVPEHLTEAQVALERAREEEEVRVEDPDPGSWRVLVWFLFSFARFVQGPMLRQSPVVLLGLLLILSMSLCAQGMEWTHPSLTSAASVFVSPAFFLRLTAWVFVGILFYIGIGFSLTKILQQRERNVGMMFGLRLVVNAFLPLGFAQSIYVLLHNALLGEAFWRGATLDISPFWTGWIFPVAWAWCGLRLAQAVCVLMGYGLAHRLMVKTGAVAAACLLATALHPAVVGWTRRDAVADWNLRRLETLKPGNELDEEQFLKIERTLPLHAVDVRRELYLFRLQQYFRQDNLDAALQDAFRLDRISPENTAMDDLAKGLRLILRGRLDLAVQRWRSAVQRDPNCLPAHQWLALASVGDNVEEAEAHARILIKQDPNVFHLYLLVRILANQEKHAAIWEAMFDVDAPPEEWYPITLLQGGLAAQELGKSRRAERLLTLAEARGMVPEPVLKPEMEIEDDS